MEKFRIIFQLVFGVLLVVVAVRPAGVSLTLLFVGGFIAFFAFKELIKKKDK